MRQMRTFADNINNHTVGVSPQVREPAELGRAGHDPVRDGERVAVLDQDGQVPGQLRTGGHREPEGGGPAYGSRPHGAGHHAGRPPEEDHEQHPGHAGAVLGQPVRGLSRLMPPRTRRCTYRRTADGDLWFLYNI